jgi:hypothetical protein
MLKNKLDYNLAHDFSQTTRDTDYFASNILTVECSQSIRYKIVRVSRASEFVFARATNFK